MHWTLPELRQLTRDEHEALIDWARDRADRMSGEEGIDMDKVIDAKKAKEEAADA